MGEDQSTGRILEVLVECGVGIFGGFKDDENASV